MFCFKTCECSCSSCSTSLLLGVPSHTAARMSKFVKNLLLEALKKHPSNTLITRKRMSKSKSFERKSSWRSIHKDLQGRKWLQHMLRCTGRRRCLELMHSRASPGAEKGHSSLSKWAQESALTTGDPMLSRRRKYPHSSQTPASGWQRLLPWAAVLVWHHSWCKRDEFTSRVFGFHRGVTRWVSANVLLSWLSKMNPCARAKLGIFMQEMLAELQETFLIKREPTSHPCFCPKGTWTLFFWRRLEKTSQNPEKSGMADLILLPELSSWTTSGPVLGNTSLTESPSTLHGTLGLLAIHGFQLSSLFTVIQDIAAQVTGQMFILHLNLLNRRFNICTYRALSDRFSHPHRYKGNYKAFFFGLGLPDSSTAGVH